MIYHLLLFTPSQYVRARVFMSRVIIINISNITMLPHSANLDYVRLLERKLRTHYGLQPHPMSASRPCLRRPQDGVTNALNLNNT